MAWEVKKLADIARINYGYTEKASFDEIGPKFLRITDIQDNGVEWSKVPFCKCNESDLLKYKLETGDIVFARTGATTGKSFLINNPPNSVFASYLIRLQLISKKDFVPKFVSYYFQTEEYWNKINAGISGSTQGGFNASKLGELLFSFPKSVTEQKRIVAILDKAFESITKAKGNTENNLKNAKEIFESYLQSVFENKGEGWEECNLEDHIKLIDYRGRTPTKTENGVRLITAKNVKLGYLELEPQEFIHQENYDTWMTRGIPNFGDVIFTTEAPLANVAQIDTKEKLAFAQRIIVMQPKKNKIDQTFLKYMLMSNPIRNKILEKGTGATVQGIKSRLLKKIKVCFPKTITEQQAIVKKLDKLSAETKKLESIYNQKLAELEELKKSILQKAFKGELTEASS
jgi:type I restriction enzyme S subunit